MAATELRDLADSADPSDVVGRDPRHRRRVQAAVVLSALVVCSLAALAVTRSLSDRSASAAAAKLSPAARLPASAAPDEVVRAYVAALSSHDISAAQALLSAKRAQTVSAEVDGWFTNLVSIGDIRLGADQPEQAGPGNAAQGYKQAVFVPVRFMLQQKVEDSMPNGDTVWGYLLARSGSDQPWVIVDEGPV